MTIVVLFELLLLLEKFNLKEPLLLLLPFVEPMDFCPQTHKKNIHCKNHAYLKKRREIHISEFKFNEKT